MGFLGRERGARPGREGGMASTLYTRDWSSVRSLYDSDIMGPAFSTPSFFLVYVYVCVGLLVFLPGSQKVWRGGACQPARPGASVGREIWFIDLEIAYSTADSSSSSSGKKKGVSE